MADFKQVALCSEITEGQAKVIEIANRLVAIYQVNGQYYAIDNNCLHQGGPLAEGELNGTITTCPWHGVEFDVTTGCNPQNPEMRVDSFDLKIEDDKIFIAI